jgi:hypothetical protein
MSTFSGLVAIVAPHFTAGIVIDCNRVKKAPPWLRFMECWTVEELQKFVQDQHWKMVELERYVRLEDLRCPARDIIERCKRNADLLQIRRSPQYLLVMGGAANRIRFEVEGRYASTREHRARHNTESGALFCAESYLRRAR